MLSYKQRAFWEDNGFLVLPSFALEARVEDVARRTEWLWDARPADVVVDDLRDGSRRYLKDVDPTGHYKINDLYLSYGEIRSLALDARLTAVVGQLMGDKPVLINSLNFERGSGQPFHVDSLYMTPLNVGNLVATWVALEDCHADAGPLAYFPGSNRIVPWQFRNGGYHEVPAEMDAWRDYIFSQVERRGLEPEVFAARRGDVFIWSANLLHGGSAIRDHKLYRRSLVSHYWSATDCNAAGVDLVPHGDALWLRRPHAEVPLEPAVVVTR